MRILERELVDVVLEEWLPWFGERRSARARDALSLLDVVEESRRRVCWCGKEFRAERNTKKCCCEAHTQILYRREHADKILAQQRERYAKKKAALTSATLTLTP